MMKFQISFEISSLVDTLQTAVTSSWKFVLFMPSYLSCSDLFAPFANLHFGSFVAVTFSCCCHWCLPTHSLHQSLFVCKKKDRNEFCSRFALSTYARGMTWRPWILGLWGFFSIFLSLGTVCTTWQGHGFSGNGVYTEFKHFKLTVLNGGHVSWHCIKFSTVAFMGSEKETIYATL